MDFLRGEERALLDEEVAVVEEVEVEVGFLDEEVGPVRCSLRSADRFSRTRTMLRA